MRKCVFFYEFYVTKVNNLLDIRKLEAFSHRLSVESILFFDIVSLK